MPITLNTPSGVGCPPSSRGNGRPCDQNTIVKKRYPLVCDRDDNLERAFRRSLGSNLLRRLRVCLPVVALVFERSVMAVGPKRKLSVCDPCRKHENGEHRRHRTDGSDVNASERSADVVRSPHCLGGRILAIPLRTSPGSKGAIPSFRDDVGEADANTSFR